MDLRVLNWLTLIIGTLSHSSFGVNKNWHFHIMNPINTQIVSRLLSCDVLSELLSYFLGDFEFRTVSWDDKLYHFGDL